MLGMGFSEIFFIIVIAIIFLGPEKLPTAMVDMMKAFKKAKKFIRDASDTLNHELEIEELKKDALDYVQRLEYTKQTIKENLSSPIENITSNIEDIKKEVNKDV